MKFAAEVSRPAWVERLDWVLDVVPVGELLAPRPGRPEESAELAAIVAHALGERNSDTVEDEIVRMRGRVGVLPSARRAARILGAISSALGLPFGFFDDPDAARACSRVLRRLLVPDEVRGVAVCRVPACAARRQLRQWSRRYPPDSAAAVAQHDGRRTPGSRNRPVFTASSWKDLDFADRTGIDPDRDDRGAEREALAMREQERPDDALRRWCRDLVVGLGMTPPLTPEALCAALTAQRGRRIVLSGAELGSTTSVGHLVVRRNSDLILFEAAAPRGQQVHVIFHELVHLLRGHLDAQDIEGGLACGALMSSGSPRPEATLYSDLQEWEAEAGATTLTEMTYARRQPARLRPDAGDIAERGLAGAFGLRTGGWS